MVALGIGLLTLFPIFQNCAEGIVQIGEENQNSQGDPPPNPNEMVHIHTTPPLEMSADNDMGAKLLGTKVPREVNLDFFRVFVATGEQIIVSDATIPLDPSKQYTLSGIFRSAGVTQSVLNFGFLPLDGDLQQIHGFEYSRNGTAVKVASLTPTEITTATTITDWQNGVEAQFRSVGFYFDGVTTHLPDFVHIMWLADRHSTATDQGGYSSATGTKISLNASLNWDLIRAVQQNPNTVVMQHTNTGWFHYTAALYKNIPSTWTPLSGKSQNLVFNPSPTNFPIGTKYLKVVVYANTYQDASAKLFFTNLKVIAE